MDQPGYTSPEAQRGLGLQLAIAASFGVISLILFGATRTKFSRIFAARQTANRQLPPLRSGLFLWIIDVYRISNRDVLKYCGLDSYAFIMFFEASVSLLWKMTLCYYVLIAPLRWWYLGQFDDPVDGNEGNDIRPNLFGLYIWVYVAATYVFTAICLFTIRRYSRQVVDVRQAYLGLQNSITDRTLRISGIPKRLRNKSALSRYLTILFRVAPEKITLCRGPSEVDTLFEKRTAIVRKLEKLYAQYIGLQTTALFTDVEMLLGGQSLTQSGDLSIGGDSPSLDEDNFASVWAGPRDLSARETLRQLFPEAQRPVGLVAGYEGEVDLIDVYSNELADVDAELTQARESPSGTLTNMAFVTMESVAQCQLASQARLSPLPHTLITTLAPSPPDIVWPNVYLKPKQRSVQNYVITITVVIVNGFLIVPLTYLARFLDIDIISKHFPNLGKILLERHWLAAFVTDVLPTYVFASFNLFVPYVFKWLSKRQGFVSKSDIELSTIDKNFFYVFVNLFLIFTIESTLFSFSMDKFAKRFAHWLIRLSSFYTNLIVLQGVGIAPSKLLQLGDITQFPILASSCKTARDCYKLYKPHRMNFGLVLPNSMFIFIVVLTYSTLRGRILLFGLIYFAVSYIVYKYQLIYTMTHPQHSNAKLWISIVRRVYLGVAVFHMAVIGVLVLQSAYKLAALIMPLTVLLLGFWYDFEKFTKPLLEFVAIEALHQSEIDFNNLASCQRRASQSLLRPPAPSADDGEFVRRQQEGLLHTVGELASGALGPSEEEESGLAEGLWDDVHEETIDEIREKGSEYENTSWSAPLTGPWIAVDGFQCIAVEEGKLKIKPIPHADWI